MADLIELYEKARLLNLQNLAHGKIELNQETVSNIDYLDNILSQELELRRQAAIKRHTNASRLPKKDFDPSRLKPGIAWQVEQLENMQWIDEGQNLVIIGKCDTGKTTLAAHIGQIALRKKRPYITATSKNSCASSRTRTSPAKRRSYTVTYWIVRSLSLMT